jgi:hypothetical protein
VNTDLLAGLAGGGPFTEQDMLAVDQSVGEYLPPGSRNTRTMEQLF